ncbi:SagB family peptide dehydrogenase [Streptomyces sp. NPDC048404]|uniref:SagB family peptide dehydrogenase n=1 Tax=unclassified Streptomyces TaxID=2593676 RepID=UPI00342B9E1E
MKVRLSACGAILWDAGQLVWDDYLDHRQFALADGTERVLRWFTDFRDLDSIQQITDDPGEADHWHRTATALTDHDILITQDGPRHQREQAIEQAWQPWGLLARAYHFSTRTLTSTAMRTAEQDNEELEAKTLTDPPPPAFWSLPGTHRIPLPDVDLSVWQHRDLIDVLHRRRSRRSFGTTPLPLTTVAALLKTAAGPLPRADEPMTQVSATIDPNGVLTDSWQRVFKTSPSGGARHPTEIYLYARNVDGLAPGIYHYAAAEHTLECLDRRLDDQQLVSAVGDQGWVADAGALIFYTSVIARNQWKYTFPRVYRALMMDVGHLSQTVYLLATAAGLHITYTAALRDQIVEELLGCDPVHQLVIGTSVIGTPDAAPSAS